MRKRPGSRTIGRIRVQSPPACFGIGGLEELLGIKLAGDEDEPAAFLADEMRDHFGPLRPQGPQVGVDQQKGIVVAQLGRRRWAAG